MSPEVLQKLDLAQCSLGEDLLAEYIGNLLDGYTLVGLVVYRSTVRRRIISNGGARSRGAILQTAALTERGLVHSPELHTRLYHKRLAQAPW